MKSWFMVYFVSTLVICCFSMEVVKQFETTALDRKLSAFDNVLNYIHERADEMNIGTIYAITLTEASFAMILLHENTYRRSDGFSSRLEQLFLHCRVTRQRLIEANTNSIDEKMNKLKDVMSDPKIWMRTIFWKRGALKDYNRPSLKEFLFSHQDVGNVLMKGQPQPLESDYCLTEIVRRKWDSGECSIPTSCVHILTRQDHPRGYPLTHRLLILQTARAMGCRESETVKFSNLIPHYCSSILQDMIDIEYFGFPNNAQDLLMEQVILCGLEGYLEFMSKHYENLILNWLHPSGCYSAFSHRTIHGSDLQCDGHATGLGAASLALFIRQDVENTFVKTEFA